MLLGIGQQAPGTRELKFWCHGRWGEQEELDLRGVRGTLEIQGISDICDVRVVGPKHNTMHARSEFSSHWHGAPAPWQTMVPVAQGATSGTHQTHKAEARKK